MTGARNYCGLNACGASGKRSSPGVPPSSRHEDPDAPDRHDKRSSGPLPEFPLDTHPEVRPRLRAGEAAPRQKHAYKSPSSSSTSTSCAPRRGLSARLFAARTALLRRQGEPGSRASWEVLIQEGAGFGRLDRRARHPDGPGRRRPPRCSIPNPMKSRASSGTPRPRASSGSWSTASRRSAKVSRSQADAKMCTYARRAQHRQRLAALRQVRRMSGVLTDRDSSPIPGYDLAGIDVPCWLTSAQSGKLVWARAGPFDARGGAQAAPPSQPRWGIRFASV